MMPFFSRDGLRIALIYVLVGVCWIFFSDKALLIITRADSLDEVTYLQTIKGFAFIGVTGMLVYVLVARFSNKLTAYYQRYKALVEYSNEFMTIIDEDGLVKYISQQEKRLSGLKRNEIVGTNSKRFIHPDDLQKYVDAIEKCIAHPDETFTVYIRLKNFNTGNWVFLESVMRNQLDKEYLKGIVINYRDISERVKAEEKAIQAAIDGEDRERKRIAKELHDSVGQYMSAAALNLGAIDTSLEQLTEKEQEKYNEGMRFLQQAIDESRNVSHNLMPRSIEDFGLVLTLQSLINRLQKAGKISFSFYSNMEKDVRLNEEVELNLYRIVQEAVNNVLKHSEATTCSIQLMKYEDEVIITIEDNGKGFDKSTYKKGIGLLNIQNRSRILGGTAVVDTHKSKGTSFTIQVPLNAENYA